MDNTAFLEGEEIRLKQKQIALYLSILSKGTFDNNHLRQIYILLESADEYDDYVGKLYTTVPDIVFSGGGGADAAATAVIEDGILADVVITDPGHDYTSPPDVVFSGGGGKGAAAHALLSGSGDTVASVVVDNVSLVSRLVNKNSDLDDDFAAL